jgi:hypothetical protein
VSYSVSAFASGDVIVTPVLRGFMICRMLPSPGPAVEWSFCKVVYDQAQALRDAVEMATCEGRRAWLNAPGHVDLVVGG